MAVLFEKKFVIYYIFTLENIILTELSLFLTIVRVVDADVIN